MRKPKLPPGVIGPAHADDIEAAFYEAFQNGDIDKLMACWADEDEIVCVHPGGHRLVGAGAIRTAFEAMFANGSIRISAEKVRKIEALAACVHSLLERIEVLTPEGPQQLYVVATNVYQKTPLGWRMVAHHASPATELEMQDVTGTPQLLH